MAKLDYSYRGFGRTFAKEKGAQVGFEIGNVSALDINGTEKTTSLPNFKTGQGNANSSTRVDTVNASWTPHDIEGDNLDMLLYGDTSIVASGTVSDEPAVAILGALVRTAQANISDVVVTNVGATVTYNIGVDYEVIAAGIVPLASGSITALEDILLTYAHGQVTKVEALTRSAKEYELTFVGLNDARDGRAVIVDIFRMKPSIFQQLKLIGDEYAAPQVTAEILADQSIIGAGLSQYFRYIYVD